MQAIKTKMAYYSHFIANIFLFYFTISWLSTGYPIYQQSFCDIAIIFFIASLSLKLFFN